jgi:hypothetical protein
MRPDSPLLPESERVYDPPLRFIHKNPLNGLFDAYGPDPDAPDDEVIAYADEWYRVWPFQEQELYQGWLAKRIEADPELARRVREVASARIDEAWIEQERADAEFGLRIA